MNEVPFQLNDLPRRFMLDVIRQFLDYSVAIVVYHPDDPSRVRIIGCGTLISVGSTHGILTAHHVIHRSRPPIQLRSDSDQIFALTISKKDLFRIPCSMLTEIEIGVPESDQDGPDLTFVQLPNIKQLGTLKATKSFWPLDNPELTPPTYDFSNTLLCTLGSRQVHQDMVVSGNRVTLDIGMIGYCGVYEMAHEFSAGRFDYIDTVVNYELGSKNLPQSFKGLSGGGLWAFRVSTPDHGKTFRIKDPFLSGVAFYQTERKDNIRKIRHHFVGSIYKEVLASLS